MKTKVDKDDSLYLYRAHILITIDNKAFVDILRYLKQERTVLIRVDWIWLNVKEGHYFIWITFYQIENWSKAKICNGKSMALLQRFAAISTISKRKHSVKPVFWSGFSQSPNNCHLSTINALSIEVMPSFWFSYFFALNCVAFCASNNHQHWTQDSRVLRTEVHRWPLHAMPVGDRCMRWPVEASLECRFRPHSATVAFAPFPVRPPGRRCQSVV